MRNKDTIEPTTVLHPGIISSEDEQNIVYFNYLTVFTYLYKSTKSDKSVHYELTFFTHPNIWISLDVWKCIGSVNVNPWHNGSREPRPTKLVAAIWQYRGPRG